MLVVLSVTLMLVDLFVAVMKVTVSVAIMQLQVSATLMPVKISAANMWVTIFIEIMQVGVSVAIMQVLFSTVHYAHDYFYCNYAGGCFRFSHVCDSFKQQILFKAFFQRGIKTFCSINRSCEQLLWIMVYIVQIESLAIKRNDFFRSNIELLERKA